MNRERWVVEEILGELFTMVNSKINKDEDIYLGEGRRESVSGTITFNSL